jgi:hypothetical protein
MNGVVKREVVAFISNRNYLEGWKDLTQEFNFSSHQQIWEIQT